MRLLACLLFAACSSSNGGSGPAGDGDGDGDNPDAGEVGADAGEPEPLECFDVSLDPDIPLAIDGVFDGASPTWQRPHDDPPACPASDVLPETAAPVPYVAYAFCNNDSVAHRFDVEMLATDGPSGEAPLGDPYLVLYRGRNIPADPLGCLAVNDDIEGALDTTDAELLGVEIPAGEALTMVLTSFTADAGYYIGVLTVAD